MYQHYIGANTSVVRRVTCNINRFEKKSNYSEESNPANNHRGYRGSGRCGICLHLYYLLLPIALNVILLMLTISTNADSIHITGNNMTKYNINDVPDVYLFNKTLLLNGGTNKRDLLLLNLKNIATTIPKKSLGMEKTTIATPIPTIFSSGQVTIRNFSTHPNSEQRHKNDDKNQMLPSGNETLGEQFANMIYNQLQEPFHQLPEKYSFSETIHTTESHSKQDNSRKAIKLSPDANGTVFPYPFITTNLTPKIQKADAPMLNYIFDSHLATNKHTHRLERFGPHFDDANFGNNGDTLINETVQAGSQAYLNCRIISLQDKTVSWVKREQSTDKLQLLTVGMQTYSADTRFSVEFRSPNNWGLRIANANKNDEGLYECQISTYPPRVITINLYIQSPEVIIIDEHGFPLVDKYYEVDSTIQLVCIVRHISMITSVVYWLHGTEMLNFEMARGGISVKSNLMDDGANSTLSIAKVRKSDSGNYTCSIGTSDFYTVAVQVLNGESLAELYHGSSPSYHLLRDRSRYLMLTIITVIGASLVNFKFSIFIVML